MKFFFRIPIFSKRLLYIGIFYQTRNNGKICNLYYKCINVISSQIYEYVYSNIVMYKHREFSVLI